MDERDGILINGLEFYGYHGASDQEQTVGHRYQVDLRMEVNTATAGISDALGDTVSYSKVARRILEIGTSERYRLLEALAARLVSVIFAEYPAVEQMRIRVVKVYPPMNAIAASVGVEISRARPL